jgi:protein-L-isoaspartate(D-aspartate) O-methyltransferase
MADQDDDEPNFQDLNLNQFLRLLAGGLHARPPGRGNEGLIQLLKNSDTIVSDKVEEVFKKIPRENFVTPELRAEAYCDTPLRFAKLGFNISAPHMHAMCMENLGIEPGDTVLDVGSGSGFLTACFSYLVGPTGIVHGLDLYDHILEFSTNNLKKFGSEYNWDNLTFIKRNCFLPAPEPIKYKRIHVGCCCPEARIQFFYDLLEVGGVLVTPYGDELLKATKLPDGSIQQKTLAAVRYSDLLLPSDAEVREAHKAIEIAKANKITVPKKEDGYFLPFVNSKVFADFSFLVGESQIYSHKLILASRSPGLHRLFKESDVKTRTIENCSYEAFTSLLRYIYGNSPIDPKYFEEVHPLALQFELEELINQISKYREDETVPVPKDDISAIFLQFVGCPFASDIRFVVGDEKVVVPCHKIILNQIDYFKNMFSSGLRESFSSEIKIRDCTVPLFMDVLTYIYTGTCEVTDSNCEGLLEQANFFQLPRLTALCEKFWYLNINVQNAATILSVTDHYNASQLKQFTIEFIFKNVKEVIKTAE